MLDNKDFAPIIYTQILKLGGFMKPTLESVHCALIEMQVEVTEAQEANALLSKEAKAYFVHLEDAWYIVPQLQYAHFRFNPASAGVTKLSGSASEVALLIAAYVKLIQKGSKIEETGSAYLAIYALQMFLEGEVFPEETQIIRLNLETTYIWHGFVIRASEYDSVHVRYQGEEIYWHENMSMYNLATALTDPTEMMVGNIKVVQHNILHENRCAIMLAPLPEEDEAQAW